MRWTRSGLFLIFMGVSGMAANGCACSPDIKPDTEAPNKDPKQSLLKTVGALSYGAQPDGSEVQFGEGATEEEAIKNGKTLVSILLKGDLDFTFTTAEQSGKWLACVRGKPVMTAGELTKKLLRKADMKELGEQPGSVEVQKGEGATKAEATDNAKTLIQMLHDDAEERDYSVQAEPLADGTWIAVVTARPSSKAFAMAMLKKHFSEAKDFGDQPGGNAS